MRRMASAAILLLLLLLLPQTVKSSSVPTDLRNLVARAKAEREAGRTVEVEEVEQVPLEEAKAPSPPTVPPDMVEALVANAALEQRANEAVLADQRRAETAKKLANLTERTLPAVVLLTGLYLIVHYFAEQGLSLLLLSFSPGLYYEAATVSTSFVLDQVQLWTWFASYAAALLVPQVLPSDVRPMARLGGFGCIMATWIAFVANLNRTNQQPGDGDSLDDTIRFRMAWQRVAKYHLALAMTVAPVACWIAALQEFGQAWSLYAALLVILNDTLAYLVGMSIGKHPLLPVISPKKTWEGWLGALVLQTVLSYPLYRLLFVNQSYNRQAFWISCYCALVSPFGGFVASSVKRAFDKKDFGDLIGGGHGGLIDRLDCQLFTAPFLLLFLRAAQPSGGSAYVDGTRKPAGAGESNQEWSARFW